MEKKLKQSYTSTIKMSISRIEHSVEVLEFTQLQYNRLIEALGAVETIINED